MDIAKQKISDKHVEFHQADITQQWNFANKEYDLLVFSLVLEHIENLDSLFQKTAKVLKPGGLVYVGELHPFKQYAGSQARFETAEGTTMLTCYTHHISDFIALAKKHGLELVELKEWFDEEDTETMPRILTLLLQLSCA